MMLTPGLRKLLLTAHIAALFREFAEKILYRVTVGTLEREKRSGIKV